MTSPFRFPKSSAAPAAPRRVGLPALAVAATLAFVAGIASNPAGDAADATASRGAKHDPQGPQAFPCDATKLPLAPQEVVAVVGGTKVRANELGPELQLEEDRARTAYCRAVADARASAIRDVVDERLIDVEARSRGVSAEALLQEQSAKVQKLAPTDEALLAYYEKNRADDAPPFESVKSAVLSAYKEDAVGDVLAQFDAELRKKHGVDVRLPVLLPPPEPLSVPAYSPRSVQSAPVTVSWFADFECPYCADAADEVEQLMKRYGTRVRFVYRHLPLDFHDRARGLAELSQCAQEQGKFWPLWRTIAAFDGNAVDATAAGADLAAMPDAHWIAAAQLDAAKISGCMSSERPGKAVDADIAEAEKLGVDATPTFFVGGEQVTGGEPSALADAIDAALQASGTQSDPRM